MLRAIILFSLCSLCYRQRSDAFYTDQTTVRMKHKIVGMDAELLKDALAKVNSIWDIKSKYDGHTSFHFGELLHKVLVRYRRMRFIYKRTENYLKVLNSSEHIENLVAIDKLFRDIDNLVEMAEKWPKEEIEERRNIKIVENVRPLPLTRSEHKKHINWSETHSVYDEHNSYRDLKEDGFDTEDN